MFLYILIIFTSSYITNLNLNKLIGRIYIIVYYIIYLYIIYIAYYTIIVIYFNLWNLIYLSIYLFTQFDHRLSSKLDLLLDWIVASF